MKISVEKRWNCVKSCGKKTHRDQGKAAYLSCRTLVSKKGGNFAK